PIQNVPPAIHTMSFGAAAREDRQPAMAIATTTRRIGAAGRTSLDALENRLGACIGPSFTARSRSGERSVAACSAGLPCRRLRKRRSALMHKLQTCLLWWRIWVRSAGFDRRIFLEAFQEIIDDLRSGRDDP